MVKHNAQQSLDLESDNRPVRSGNDRLRGIPRTKFSRLSVLIATLVLLFWCLPVMAEELEEEPGFWEAILQDFVNWCICFFVDLVSPVLDALNNALPSGFGAGASQLGEYIDFCNYFAPLDHLLAWILVYLVFLLFFIVIRSIIRLIPGEG